MSAEGKDFFAIVSSGAKHVVVEGALISPDPALKRALSMLSKRPPFNGDPRVKNLSINDYWAAEEAAIKISGIDIALEPYYTGRTGQSYDCIAVGKLGAMTLKTAEDFSEGSSVYNQEGLRRSLDGVVGPNSQVFFPTVYIS